MGLKTEKKTFGHLEVTVTQQPVMRQLALLPRLAKAIERGVEKLNFDDLSTSIADADAVKILPALVSLVASMPPGEFQGLVRDLNASTQIITSGPDGRMIVETIDSDEKITRVFEGSLLSLLQVSFFAAVVNFRDFFSGLVTSLPGPVARVE